MRRQTLAPSCGLELSCSLIDSYALSSSLNVLKIFMRVDESFLSFVVTLDVLSSTLVLVWAELMLVDES